MSVWVWLSQKTGGAIKIGHEIQTDTSQEPAARHLGVWRAGQASRPGQEVTRCQRKASSGEVSGMCSVLMGWGGTELM